MTKCKIAGWLAALVVLAILSDNRTWGADEKPKAPPAKKPVKKPVEKSDSAGKGVLTRVGVVNVGGKAQDICLSGDRAYVATTEGLTILDISNADAPKKLGSVNFSGPNQGVVIKGKHAFLASAEKGLVVVDVSNESAPKLVTSKPIFKCWSVAVKDNVVYALALKGTLYVFDISNPTDPKQVLSFGLPHIPKILGTAGQKQLDALKANTGKGGQYKSGVSVSGDKMVAVDWNYGRIYLYNLSKPAKPAFMGTHYAPFLLQARVSGEWIYALGAYRSMSGIRSVKLSEQSPDKPTSYLNCPTCGFARADGSVDQGGMGVSESGKHVFWYGGKTGEFHVIDISDPGKMKKVASDRIPDHGVELTGILGVTSRDDRIFVCAGEKGVVIYRYPGL